MFVSVFVRCVVCYASSKLCEFIRHPVACVACTNNLFYQTCTTLGGVDWVFMKINVLDNKLSNPRVFVLIVNLQKDTFC